MMIQGRKMLATAIGFVEVTIFITAIGKTISGIDSIWNILGYSGGFAAGTLLGLCIEEYIGLGYQVIRVITASENHDLIEKLRAHGFGLTKIDAEGREGPVFFLISVIKRKDIKDYINIVNEAAPNAFYTVEDTKKAYHGHFQHVPIKRK